MVVECPQCHSKFNLDDNRITAKTVRLRCKICSNVFTLGGAAEKEGRSKLEQEFESLLSDGDQVDRTDDSTLEGPEDSIGISVNTDEVQPESVIREIDSILGSSEELGEDKSGKEPDSAAEAPRRKTGLIGLLVLALATLLYLGYAYNQGLPPFGARADNLTQPPIQAEYFVIPQTSVSYEILPHETEGEVLVFKGYIERKTNKPIQNIMIQARVLDEKRTLLEAKDSYAGVVPDNSEFSKLPAESINALLTAQPQDGLAFDDNGTVPFAVAFFGKATADGKFFEVEIKGFDWQ